MSYPEARGANKNKEKKRKPRHPLNLLPSGGPWKSSACLVTVFTQPAGHTLCTQGSPELSERSLLPRIPEAPASGCSAPPLTGVPESPWVVQSRGPPRTSVGLVQILIYRVRGLDVTSGKEGSGGSLPQLGRRARGLRGPLS